MNFFYIYSQIKELTLDDPERQLPEEECMEALSDIATRSPTYRSWIVTMSEPRSGYGDSHNRPGTPHPSIKFSIVSFHPRQKLAKYRCNN